MKFMIHIDKSLKKIEIVISFRYLYYLHCQLNWHRDRRADKKKIYKNDTSCWLLVLLLATKIL